jgi:Uma2 family endonuclease
MPVPLYSVSVEQYHQMIEKGIFQDGDPVELVEGMLVKKMTKHEPHSLAASMLIRLLTGMLNTTWYIRVQDPVTTTDSEPEPDVCIVRGDPRHYCRLGHPPGPDDTGLLIEVADTSLAFDRGHKRRVYARAGIPTYWIVNIPDRIIEVYTDPTGPIEPATYLTQHDFAVSEDVPVMLDGMEVGRIGVADLFL